MCGIYGELDLTGQRRVSAAADQATDLLSHRGPDERGSWHGPGVFLGMRRLSIIDLNGGTQPIWNETASAAIVFNGELYNYRELKPELEARGHRFRTKTDTEVVLHAYEQWGTDCLKRFNGMFAFAVWDGPKRRLFVARDRLGEKPLYYLHEGDRLRFASEIKAILADRSVERAIDPRGLVNYLAFGHAVAPDTMYQGIRKLLPGHFLLAEAGVVREASYWDVGDDAPALDGPPHTHTAADFAALVRELLDDSVRLRMVADVPVGAFLSGGVDSSAVVALMARHASAPVKTFSIGFGTDRAYNELDDARTVAQALGTEHHELLATDVDLVDTLKTLVYHYDEPFGDEAGFPTYLLSRFARDHVKVVLTGDGADELFGGYRRYAADQASSWYQRLPRALSRSLIPAAVGNLPRLRRVKRAVDTLPITDPARRYAAWLTVFSREMRSELLAPAVASEAGPYDPSWPYSRYYTALDRRAADDHLNRMMYVDVKTWLPDAYLEKVDKATMACGLEARLPMLDPRLVELAFTIPGRFKIRGGSLKRVLKQAVRGLVPDSVLAKRKRGFAVPTDPWFRGPLKEFAFEVLLDPGTRGRGYFNSGYVERLWKEHFEGRQVRDAQLWLLLNFELWHRAYLDGEAQ
jgi:asparagine synthase (glutamine-hydrolysing)